MDELDLNAVCAELATQVAHEASKRLGKKWRCPRGLREEVVAYALACRENGEAVGSISGRLGLVESTLARWLRKKMKRERPAPCFRSVAIVPAEEIQRSTCGAQLRLITADGHVIEGLDLESAAFLLKAIR